jgi:hypothetical protein
MTKLKSMGLIACISLAGLYSTSPGGELHVDGAIRATVYIGDGSSLTGVLKSEEDPLIGALTPDKWCKTNATGTAIDCSQDQPAVFRMWVPRTGKTTCWDENGNARPCAGTGEDGEYQMGGKIVAPSPGPTWHPSFLVDPRFKDNNDGTVTDNLTGLIWMKNANCIADNTGFDNDGTADDGHVTWQHALDFVRGLNSGLYNCGDSSDGGQPQTDWRLPNIHELTTLIDPGESDPALPAGYPFSKVQLGSYASSTTPDDVTSKDAYWVSFGQVRVYGMKKTNTSFSVWPVRGGKKGGTIW